VNAAFPPGRRRETPSGAVHHGRVTGVRERPAARIRLVERVDGTLTSVLGRLPPRLRRVLPRELVGFAILGGFTFLVDLALLSALHAWTGLPEVADVSIAYLSAFALNFVLNRTLNFRSHAPVSGQALRYLLVIGCDYGMTLGVTTGLSGLGLDFRLARLTAAGCVAVFTYTAARRWVFDRG
jgi:putative flippase GtrA